MFAKSRWLSGLMKTTFATAFLAVLVTAVVMVVRPSSAVDAAEPIATVDAAMSDDTNLQFVPADAAGFVHLHLAELWKNDLFAEFRKSWEMAGAKAIETFNKQFIPMPSSLDKLTLFVLMDPVSKQPGVFGVVGFSAPFDPALVAELYLPRAEKKIVSGKVVYIEKNLDLAVVFPDNKHAIIGEPKMMTGYLSASPAKTGPLAGALKLATQKPIVGAVNVSALPIPPQAIAQLPPDFQPLAKAELIVASLSMKEMIQIDLTAKYSSDASATDAHKAVQALAALGRGELAKAKKALEEKLYAPNIKTPRKAEELPEALGSVFALGAINQADQLLVDPNLIQLKGSELAFSKSVPKEILAPLTVFVPVSIGLLLPAVQKVRAAAARSQSSNNMKQIALGILNYESAYGVMPSDILDKNGKPILSWRVAILPYIEQNNLYQSFKLNEPWDSPNNKKFSSIVIKTYLSPNEPQTLSQDGYGLTSYKGISGPGSIFQGPKGSRIVDITDGTSNTIGVIEDGNPIPWAKPGDFFVDPKKPLPKIKPLEGPNIFLAGFVDGSVRAIPITISEKTLRALFSRAGGEVIESYDK